MILNNCWDLSGRSLSLCFVQHCRQSSVLTSTASLVSVTAATVGSIAWYTHLYGHLPFIGELSANSPAEDGLHPAAYPWSHKGLLETFDHAR
jgi:ubiquinol-cytochrome c reductase cytochrome c1 subunit